MSIAALSLLLLAASSAQAKDPAAGQRVYLANCMACHGMNADGKGPAAISLQPPPSDFTSETFWATRDAASIRTSIRAGRPGTPMMPFTQLSDADLDNLIAFLESKRP